jgi:hypothetical protein
MGSPPIAGANAPQGVMTSAMAAGAATPGAGADAANAQLESLAVAIREIGGKVQSLVGQNPALAAEGQQIGQLLKLMIVKAASQAQMTSVSSEAVPTGGV